MSNREIIDSLELMLESIRLVQERFVNIGKPDDFVLTSQGITLLDAIAMRLQVIGETVKKIQKLAPSALKPYTDIEWDSISKFRDLVSHHYDSIDYEIVYDICHLHVPKLKAALLSILSDA